MDAQLGRIPAEHASATMVTHLNVRQIMLMTFLDVPGRSTTPMLHETCLRWQWPALSHHIRQTTCLLPLFRSSDRNASSTTSRS